MKKKKRRRSLLIILLIIVLLWFFNNFSVKLTKQTVYSGKISNDIKIAVLSDLHGVRLSKNNHRITDMISRNEPDLIFVLGDMYTKQHNRQIDVAINLIQSLSQIADTYVVTGEHDTDDEYIDKLNSINRVHLMSYKEENITVNGNNITIYGIDNVYFTPNFDLHNEFNEPDQSRYNILLSHQPETEHFDNFGVDMIFSGDTHGGMIRLPVFGPAYYEGYILPKLTFSGRMTDKGLFELENNKQIFVTSGIGNYPVPMRFLNRPEVCIITLKKEIAQ